MAHDLDTLTTGYRPPADPHERGNGQSAHTGHPDATPTVRRRWPWLVVGLAVGGAATYAVVGSVDDPADADQTIEESVELTTVQVSSQDLVEAVEWSGTLSSGLTIDVSAPADGIVTASVASGDHIERGDVVVEIDDQPVVALLGEIPMWRDLAEGDDGADVRQLEANLVQLGYDPDGDVTIDDEYTSATEDMVERWEEDLGLEATGEVPMRRVVVLPGPTEVVDAPAVGATARTGSTLMTVDALASRIDVIGWQIDTDTDTDGELTFLAPVATPIEHGTVLYTVDDVDAVAVVDSDPTSDAVLDAIWSADVELIESVIVFAGFDPDGLIEIDDDVDLHTAAAVIRWQESVGLPATGSTHPSDYIDMAAAVDVPYAVGEVYLEPGEQLGTGEVVMALQTPTLTVIADVAVGELDEFSVGDVVAVEQLDESTFVAEVVSIADVANESEGQDATPTITVTFDVVDAPETYVSGAVTITTESSRIDDAMVVPSRALVALREGGFAVEKQLADGTTELVGVEIGTFDDSMVEVVSVTVGDLSVGDELVVPS